MHRHVGLGYFVLYIYIVLIDLGKQQNEENQ